MKAQGIFHVKQLRNGILIAEWDSPNLVVNQGLNHLLNVGFNAATQVSTWYVALFEGNYTPVAGDTAATFPGSATECTAYNEATRVTYNEATSSAQSITNAASVATFTGIARRVSTPSSVVLKKLMAATPTTSPSSTASETIPAPPGFRSNHHVNSSSVSCVVPTRASSATSDDRHSGV